MLSGMMDKIYMAALLALLLLPVSFAIPSNNAMSSEDWLNNSKTFFRESDFDKSLFCAEKAIEMDASLSNAWFFKGECLKKKGKLRASIASYDMALQINPRYILAWNSRGISLNGLGRYEEAINCFDWIIEIENIKDSGASESLREATMNKGEALRQIYRYSEALECYDELARFNDTLALSEKGVCLAYLKRYDEAMQCFNETVARTKALKNDNSYIRAEINMGIAFLLQKDPDSALACFDEAISYGKGYDKIWTAWFCKGVALESLDRKEVASGAFHEAASLRIREFRERSKLQAAQEQIKGFLDIFWRIAS